MNIVKRKLPNNKLTKVSEYVVKALPIIPYFWYLSKLFQKIESVNKKDIYEKKDMDDLMSDLNNDLSDNQSILHYIRNYFF